MSDDEGDYDDGFGEDFDPDLADEEGAEGLGAPDDKGDEPRPDDDADDADDADDDQAEGDDGADDAAAADDEDAEHLADDGSGLSRPASAARARIDPVLKISNSHRRVVIITGDDRITSNVLQIPEAARCIAIRAKQIESDPTVFVDVDGETDSVAIATKELVMRRSPLKLRRIVGRGSGGELYVEEWRTAEMVIPPLAPSKPH